MPALFQASAPPQCWLWSVTSSKTSLMAKGLSALPVMSCPISGLQLLIDWCC